MTTNTTNPTRMEMNAEPNELGLMERVPLRVGITVKEAIMTLSEGNPGSINVMCQFLHLPECAELLMTLDEMNLRGRQIFVAYRLGSNQNMLQFIDNLKQRNQLMCDIVNDACINHRFKERAVVKRGRS